MTMDEEYIRTVFALEHRSSDHPVAAKLLAGEIQRSYDNSPAFLRRIAGSMELREARARGGIIVPDVPVMTVESQRITRVLQKIVRGLFYAVNERALPRSCPVNVTVRMNEQQFHVVNSMMDGWRPNTGWWNIGDEKAFSFKAAMHNTQSTNSIWLLYFYQSMMFCAHTVPLNRPG